MQNANLIAIFLTGLFTGGLTCLAVQGGLLAATIAQQEEERIKSKAKKSGNALPILAFLASKLATYTLLGLLLGLLGSFFQLSLGTQVFMQVAVAIFMIGTALNILDVHPLFRYFVIQPPRFLTKMLRNQSKSRSVFAPALLGALTVFIPCGTTQAIMALAIGSGSPVIGALILFSFILGTSPLLFILGYFATKLSDAMHQKFMKIAAYTLILLALFNIGNAFALTGTKLPFSLGMSADNTAIQPVSGDVVKIEIEPRGYSPNSITVKAGQEVTFEISNKDTFSCATAFTIPYFQYQKMVQAGSKETVTFKMPDVPTQIPFMCSMNMYRGVINVI